MLRNEPFPGIRCKVPTSMFLRSQFPCSKFLRFKVLTNQNSCWFKVSTVVKLKAPTFLSSYWCKAPTIAKFLLVQSYYSFKVPMGSMFLQFKIPSDAKFLQVRLGQMGAVLWIGKIFFYGSGSLDQDSYKMDRIWILPIPQLLSINNFFQYTTLLIKSSFLAPFYHSSTDGTT